MKIVLIHGQSHQGSSYHIGRMLAAKLAAEADITEFFLPRDLPHFCLGCYACVEDETKCPYWAEKQPMLSAMEQASLFILTTPNYCLAPSAAMKSFLDLFFDLWMVHRPKAWMFRKRAVLLSCSAGASCRAVFKPLRASLSGWGVPDIRAYGRPVQAMHWNGVKDDVKARIEKDMEKLAKKLLRDKPPRIGLKTRFLFAMMRMMHAAGWDASPVEKQYWEAQGWLGKTRPWKRA